MIKLTVTYGGFALVVFPGVAESVSPEYVLVTLELGAPVEPVADPVLFVLGAPVPGLLVVVKSLFVTPSFHLGEPEFMLLTDISVPPVPTELVNHMVSA